MALINESVKANELLHSIIRNRNEYEKAYATRELAESVSSNVIIRAIKDLQILDAESVCQFMPRSFMREFMKELIKDENDYWITRILDNYDMQEFNVSPGTYGCTFYKMYALYRDNEIENFYNFVKLYIKENVYFRNKSLPLKMFKSLFDCDTIDFCDDAYNDDDFYPDDLLSKKKTTIYNHLPADLVNRLYYYAYDHVYYTNGIDMICENEDPMHIYFYARDIEGADIAKLTDAIIRRGNGLYIYYFAKDIKGADIDKLTDAVIKSGDPRAIYNFALNIKCADIEKLTDGKVKTKSIKYILEISENVKGVDLDKFKNIELSLSGQLKYYDKMYHPETYINRHNQDALVDLVVDTVCKSGLENSIYCALVFSHNDKLSLSHRDKLIDAALQNRDLKRKGLISSILLSFSELKIAELLQKKYPEKHKRNSMQSVDPSISEDRLKSLPILINDSDLNWLPGLENALKSVVLHEESAISDSARKKLEEYLYENESYSGLLAMGMYLKSADEERIADRLVKIIDCYRDKKENGRHINHNPYNNIEIKTALRCVLPEIENWSANERLLKAYYRVAYEFEMRDFLSSNREYVNEITKNLIYERRIDDLERLISGMTLKMIDLNYITDLVCETGDAIFMSKYCDVIRHRRSKYRDENIKKVMEALDKCEHRGLVKRMANTTKNTNDSAAKTIIKGSEEIKSAIDKIKTDTHRPKDFYSIMESIRNLNDEKLNYATDLVCDSGDAHLIFNYAFACKGYVSIDKEKLTIAICNTGNVYYITEFLLLVHGDKLNNMLEAAVKKYGTPEDVESFKQRKSEIEYIDMQIPY